MDDPNVDERFQIDDRFQTTDADYEYEQQRRGKKKERKAVKSFQRFDPENPEHVAWMESQKVKAEERKKHKPVDAETFNNELDASNKKVIEGQFYEVDRSFAEELQRSLAKKANGATEKFSFLSMIGRKVDEEPETSTVIKDEEDTEALTKSRRSKKTSFSTELDDESKVHKIEEPYFFIDTNATQFKNVLKSFSLQQDIKLIRKKWEKEREKIIARYKDVHKKATRKKEYEEKKGQNKKRKRVRNNQYSNKKNKKIKVDE